jgi:glycosyltransferase involved in cell wall biosynthesis
VKIAILADPLDTQYAGIHIYTRELVRALVSAGSAHSFVIVRSRKRNEFPGAEELVVPVIKQIPGQQSLRLFLQIPLKLARMGVDLVIEPSHFGPFNLPKRIRRVTVIHDITPILFPKLHVFHSQLLQRIFLPGIMRRADHIITNSDYTTQDLNRHFPLSKGKTIRAYPGREAIFRPVDQPGIPAKYGIHGPYFLYVGTIEPRKNLTVLLAAYKIFRQEHSQAAHLVIVGKRGWKSEAFFDELESNPFRQDIHLPGYVAREDLPALYSHAEAFVYPSVYEGFGLPVLEAMSCETACILSDRTSLPEVGGDAAIYFDPEDPRMLAAHLIRMVEEKDLRRRLAAAGLERAKTFSWESTARTILDQIS